MTKKRLLTLILLLFAIVISAQTTDLARIEYLYQPFSKSKNSISRFRILTQIPISLDKEKNKLLVVGLEYRYVNLNIKDSKDVIAFNDNMLNSVQQTHSYLAYTWKNDKNWRFGIKAGVKVQSDFQGALLNDDFIYDVGIYAVNDHTKEPIEGEKPSRLIMGLTYSNTPGRWYPLPILNYYKEFHPDWTYTLGFPKTNIRYYLNDSHKDVVQVFATLDNIFANIQNNFVPISATQNKDRRVAESIQETMILLGAGYEHFFTKHLLFYAYAAHSVYNNFKLEDGEGKRVYKINTNNSPYLRAGIKFKY